MDDLTSAATETETEPATSPGTGSKRPAGRTKFRETRHPVFRGVRRRGRAGRWVCEVRVPGGRGDRLWVGTFDTAEAAARAHDAAMLALRGGTAAHAGLNFADSAWLLRVPRAAEMMPLPDVQRAATEAVADFMRRRSHGGSSDNSPDDAAAARGHRGDADSDTAASSAAAVEYSDVFGGMDAGSYYASLAQGLLIDPPPPPAVGCPEEDDEEYGAAGEMELWS
ncbi:hypothetical protein U9M48_037936 [Paspalum notatum var. saurae]|uniref:AP2/ERF domain-containing protein n=1 Tax=Paspalum notatum var. saurae TaxID=547442 RepID=A0AAQ3XB65_PASNO